MAINFENATTVASIFAGVSQEDTARRNAVLLVARLDGEVQALDQELAAKREALASARATLESLPEGSPDEIRAHQFKLAQSLAAADPGATPEVIRAFLIARFGKAESPKAAMPKPPKASAPGESKIIKTTLSQEQQEQVLAAVRSAGPAGIGMEDLTNQLPHLDRKEVLIVIKNAVNNEDLVRVGQARGTRYVAP